MAARDQLIYYKLFALGAAGLYAWKLYNAKCEAEKNGLSGPPETISFDMGSIVDTIAPFVIANPIARVAASEGIKHVLNGRRR